MKTITKLIPLVWRIRVILIMGTIACYLTISCSETRDMPSADRQETEINSVRQDYSNLGTERLIPIRVINCLSAPGDPNNISLTMLQHTVEEANEVYKDAGVQFYVSKIDSYVMPVFADLDERNSYQWSSVRDQLKLAFPNLSLTAWSDTNTQTEFFWLRRVAAVYGAPHELLYWTHKNVIDAGGNQIHFGTYPDSLGAGRAAVNMIGDVIYSPAPTYVFAHEVGHTLGLAHTQSEPANGDPKDVTPRTPSDVWDLVYTPGNPNVFYSTRSAVETAESQGKNLVAINIDVGANNCQVTDATGTVRCTVNGTVYQTGGTDGALKGIGFQYPRGPNVMSYIPDYPDKFSETYSKAISTSQIELILRYLRYERPLPQAVVDAISPPAGVYLNSDRPNLGSYDVQRSGVYPLDFDGDGKRDLAVWDPPATVGGTGTFRILGSRLNWNTQWTVSFGVLGDVPFVQDFNGDGCTDVGVWRTSGASGTDASDNNAYFVYCPSSGAPNCPVPSCANPKTANFGLRSDAPLSNTNYHGGLGEIAVFRPSTGTFYWRSYVSGGTNGGFPGPTISHSLGNSEGSVPITGDFDDDGKTDPTVYSPNTANFYILRSAASYAQWSRSMGTKFIPSNSPDPSNPLPQQSRAGAYPLEAVGILLYSRPAVYFPYDGTFNIMWDVATPGSIVSCAWGGDSYVPITPSVDRDNDWRTDLLVVTEPTVGPPVLHFKDSHSGDCNGGTQAISSNSWNGIVHYRAFSSSVDMTGDGKLEIMLLDEDTMTFHWLTSESGYSGPSDQSRQLGTQRSVPL